MLDTTYNWKRYWVPREGGFSFDSRGFLLPPASDAEWAKWWKTDVVGFDDLLAKPCLVLLGEPGIGKSFAIRDAERRERAAKHGSGATFFYRDLGMYNSDAFLVEDVFRSPEFIRWRETGGEFRVFLDSFDECLLRVDAVASLLAEQFNRFASVQNLFLRIASRTAEWQITLEDALRAKWGKDSVDVYELAPLTRDQVFEAAKLHVAVPESFIEAIITNEVVSFAIKPLTLNLLIRIWLKRGGSLPPTQREIYEQGCLELCSDSEKRQTPKLRGNSSPEQRLAIASHIAAATFFCNRAAVWKGSYESTKPEADISIAELADGSVSVRGQQISVTEVALREALDTGLFTSRGKDRLGWAHQTYGEFLAARYVVQERLSGHQVLDLLTHPHDPERRLIPQLQETAAWIASSNRELFDRLALTEPGVLLRSDVATADAQTKSAIVDALLAAVGADSVHGDWWAMRARYGKLRHSHLARQICRYLRDRSIRAGARIEAVQMVDLCELSEVLPLLTRMALDTKEVQELREWAAGLVARKGSPAERKRLKPLALGDVGPDQEHELRGAGLKACWPDHISASELFASLKQPDDRLHGLYYRFVSQELVERLLPSELPTALAWAEQQPEQHDSVLGGYEGLVMRILDKAAEHLESAGVLVPFARTLLARLRKHDFSMPRAESALTRILESRPDLRLKVAETIVTFFNDANQDAARITHCGLRLIGSEHFDWVVERLRGASGPEAQKPYACLLSWIFHPDDASRVNTVIEVSKTCPIVVEVMPVWLKPMMLDSDEARNARDFFVKDQQHREKMEQLRQQKLLSPLPAEHVVALLDQCEAGDMEAWWKLCLWLEVEDNGRYCEKHYHMDIREIAGWKKASDATKARMIGAAHRYICNRDPVTQEWFWRKNIKYHPAVAGFRALLLLANESPGQFDSLPDDVWRRWAPAILRPTYYDELDEHRVLTGRAFQRSHLEATKWIVEVLNQENKEGDNLWVLSKLPDVWSDALRAALLARARERKLKPQCMKQLLTALLEHRVAGALEITRSLIPKKPPVSKLGRLTGLFVARLLMLHGASGDWPRVWRLITVDAAFGRTLMEGFRHDFDHAPAPILRTLSETDVSLLWEWMLSQYPIAGDPDRSRGGTVTTRHSMADLRDNLISHLANLGTVAGCKELQRLLEKYPQFRWFRRVLMRGQEQMRRNTWTPPLPSDLFDLTKNLRARLVQSPSQLLETISDSLAVLQDKLRGERMLAQFLWDGDRPKPEEAISEWVAAHLEDDLKQRGVVLGREVQIHRFDKTDIHVTAVTRDARTGVFDHAKVIIEIKGSWHREVKTAMKHQLVERYLADNECHHGVYLVAWYPLDAWSKSDRRRKQVAFATRKALETYFEKQARELCTEHRTIRASVLDCSMRSPATRKRSVRIPKKGRLRSPRG